MGLPLVVGNWKMHGAQAAAVKLARQISRGLAKARFEVQVVLAPPYTAIPHVRKAIAKTPLGLAGQNAHWQTLGAFTGEVSPMMLKDAGCTFVILGHSERRQLFYESDQTVAKKIAAALTHDLRPILCVGETLNERERGATRRVISRQLQAALKGLSKNVIRKIEIAYEPVWAIGTGQNATAKQIARVHRSIRKLLVKSYGSVRGGRVRILYGGSVKPDNATELAKAAEVNGFLVGGASLEAESFLPIVRCLART